MDRQSPVPARTPEPGLEGLVRVAAAIAGAPVAAVNLVDGDRLTTEVGLGLPRGPLPEGAFCVRVVGTGRPLAVADAAVEPHWAAMADAGVRGYLGLPVTAAGGEVLGTLCVMDPGPRTFEPQVVEQLEVLAQAAVAYLELRRTGDELRARLHEREALLDELERLSRTDPLTGALNRRAMDEALAREVGRADRDGGAFSLLLLDLDHFKAFNDRYGHPAGDRLLQQCAAAWEGIVRRGDLLCRYGGEEFAVLAAGTGARGAAELAERLRAALPGDVTTSVGVTTWRPGDTPSDLLDRADVALYAAKAAGRDRVEVAPAPVAVAR